MTTDCLVKTCGFKATVISIDAFGAAVWTYVNQLLPGADLITTHAVNPIAPLFQSEHVVLAGGRPAPVLCEQLDNLVAITGITFIPALIQSDVLRIGPVIAPDCPGCWTCWERRARQHSTSIEEDAALSNFYRQASPGPKGFLPALAALAAARITEIINSTSRCATFSGRTWEMDLLTRTLSQTDLIGVDDCRRCGLHRPAKSRTFAQMRRELYPYLAPANSTSSTISNCDDSAPN
jgi:bacteriocin biosynthesis cyclodehydratase domain-containing protein